MLYVRTRPWVQSTRRRRLGALPAFLEEQRDDGLAGLPPTAVIQFAEMPRVAFRPPKGLDKYLFDQIIDPENLSLLGSEQHRTLILLLAHTGLRVSSLVLLRRDALQIGSDGHPYLRLQCQARARGGDPDRARARRAAAPPGGPPAPSVRGVARGGHGIARMSMRPVVVRHRRPRGRGVFVRETEAGARLGVYGLPRCLGRR
jgi:hypothetical protein